MEIIKVAVDVRDLQISASGARSYLESVIIEFKKEHPGFAFYFLDAKTNAYTGNHFLLKLKEQLSYFLWKQIILPYKSKVLGCQVLFCSDFMVPYFSLGIKTIPVFHDAFFWEYPQHYNKYWLLFFRNLGLAAAKKAAFVVTPTQYASNQLSKYTGIPQSKIIAIGEAPKTIENQNKDYQKKENQVSTTTQDILNTDYILQEKIYHAFFSGAIPIFFGNKHILEEGFNPESFINLHDFTDLNDFLSLVKEIDNNETLHRKYIESPIFVDNKLPDYYSFDYTLNFLEKIVES